MYCSESLASFSRTLSLILWLIVDVCDLAVLTLMIRIFKKYHLFFITFYTFMVITRMTVASIKVTGYILVLQSQTGTVPEQVDIALGIAKFCSQAAALACVVERAYATHYATVYENSRRCSLVTICFVVCAISFTLNYADMAEKVTSVVYGVVIAIATISLIIINRKLVVKSAAKSNLSERYQLTENVKTLRLLLPFVVALSVNAITLSIGIVFFEVNTDFNISKCQSVPIYLPVFFLILIETTFFNSCAPLYVLYLNRNVLRRRKNGVAELRNVLGVKIVGDGRENEHYFQQYKTQWS